MNIAEDLDQWPENMPLGVQSTMQKLTGAIHSLANEKAVGPDGVSVELFKIALNGDPALRRRLLDIVVRIWREGEVPQQLLLLLLFLTFSALVANPNKLLYTVANPARGLLNREKKKKKKSGSAPPKIPSSWYSTKRRIGQSAVTTGTSRW